jgi:hypothetical protein
MRISYIEEEIESMNRRVEKLASDSYEIRGEVRDIHESVMGMQTSLSEIVKLYKAIITQYGFGDMKAAAERRQAPRPRPGEDPGDAIIRALEEEQGRNGKGASPRAATPKATTPKRAETVPRQGTASSPAPPPPRAAPRHADPLDELHRLSEAHNERASDRGEDLASLMASRSGRDDRVDRVARREVDRSVTGDMDREGDFTRSLPKKELRPKADPGSPNTRQGDGWESMEPPPGPEGRGRRAKPKLEDLLSPE